MYDDRFASGGAQSKQAQGNWATFTIGKGLSQYSRYSSMLSKTSGKLDPFLFFMSMLKEESSKPISEEVEGFVLNGSVLLL